MSVEFRQRTASEFIGMLKRRKWLILLPVLTMTAAIGYVVYKLPSVYESKTLLTVQSPRISEKVVQSLTNEDLSQRLQAIKQEVLSRSSLEPMIGKYKLFELERNAGKPTELIVAQMLNNIDVEAQVNDEDRKIAAFKITYRDRSPEAARNVTAELAGKFVNAQMNASVQTAEMTQEFLEKQLGEAKNGLDGLEKQRLDIMMQNVETLPDSSQGLIAQLQGLRQREDTIAKEKESLMTQRGRLSDSIRAMNSQTRIIEDFGEKETQDVASQAARVEDTPAYIQLINKRAELSSKLDNLKLTLKDKNPKVIEAQNDLNKVNEEVELLKKSTQTRVKDLTSISTRKADFQKKSLEVEKQKAESEIGQIDGQMQYKDEELRQNAGQISVLESKINQIPNVKVALEGINNQYQSAKTVYDDRLKKYNDAQQQVARENNAQGETIKVQDAANLPSSPVAPKRAMLTALGAGIGLMLGLFLAAVFELPRVLKIQNIEDAKHYTGLPILASVPPLYSHSEKAWLKRSHYLKVLAGAAVAIAVIPLIVMALQASRIFERVVS